MHQLAADTVVQHYFNDNSRGIDPYVGRIYQNQPQAYLRTMDDDAGAMSAWYGLAACGALPACVGEPAYYLSLPLFEKITLQTAARRPLAIRVENYAPARRYIQAARLNGWPLTRNWLTHQELAAGGSLVFVAADLPNPAWGTRQQWLSGEYSTRPWSGSVRQPRRAATNNCSSAFRYRYAWVMCRQSCLGKSGAIMPRKNYTLKLHRHPKLTHYQNL